MNYTNKVLQFAVAAIMTTGTVLPVEHSITNPVLQKPIVKPVEAPQAPVVPEPVIVWQDNPNGCTDGQWIAAEAPFVCIDKPVAAPVAVSQSVTESPKTYPTQAPTVVAGCGDNFYAQFIYKHESGCNLTAVNSKGCIGIGQSCPGGSGLAADCPDWRTNYACQNAHFTRYAERYGGWAGSYSAWQSKGWW